MQTPDAAVDGLLRNTAFLEDLRAQMLRFATLQLNDRDLAEDAVQDALASALRSAGAFAGRSALKTWVFAILKNKIVDVIRQRSRLVYAGSMIRNDEDEDSGPAQFDQRGHWQREETPATWGVPDDALQDEQFWRVFEACLDGLPARQGRVFMMREFVGLEADEICTAVAISSSNLHVLLHRARLRLRDCLESKWFEGGCERC
jgi:RNA polymerase sigma-70 factor (TIGR02943 family)